ncbi:ABC1-domain-containing protein [Clavulina sp. PMI_390]|nr:ABC1-domain-containing protein [Clavulina sp. PMI_390]
MAALVGRSAQSLRTSLPRAARFPRRITPLRSFHANTGGQRLDVPPRRRVLDILILGVPLQPPVTSALSNPALIPCPDDDARPRSVYTHQMSSPNEDEHKTITRRVLDLVIDRIWEPLCTGARFLHLFVLFMPVILTSPMLFVGQPRRKGGDGWGALWWYGFLVAQMQRAGPTFIKLAQWAGSRHDLFPAKLCERLGSLHSNGRPHSFAHTKRVIERAFRRPFNQVFQEFDPEPIGTGAIAQVYRAVLNPELLPMSYLEAKAHPRSRSRSRRLPPSSPSSSSTSSDPQPPPPSPTPIQGIQDRAQRVVDAIAEAPRALASPDDAHPPIVPTSSVAIKILHPGVEPMIRRDLAIMSFFASCLTLIPGIEWLSLKDEINVFGSMMNEQIDLRVEAANLRTFERNFAGRRSAVTFPRPLEDFSGKNVLVEEFQNALPLKAFLKHGGGPYDHRLANLGLDAFLNMLLLDNFVHSDLHPGNIMVKFYKPTTSYVYKNIFASIFNTTPPSTDLSPSSDPSPSPIQITPDMSFEEIDQLSPSQQSDAIVMRLKPLLAAASQAPSSTSSHSSDEDDSLPNPFLAELANVAEQGYLPSLVFIDAGLTTVLNSENRRNFLDLFRAIAHFDGYLAGTLMVERCRTPQLVIDKETFALKMQHLVLSVKSRTFSLATIKISDILTQVLQNVRTHHVRMEGDFVNTVLAVLLLEGIGRQLDPGMDLFKSSLPILRQLGGQMSAKEAMDELPREGLGGNLAAMLKIWVWIEARELVSGAIVNVDDMIKHDW